MAYQTGTRKVCHSWLDERRHNRGSGYESSIPSVARLLRCRMWNAITVLPSHSTSPCLMSEES